MKKRKTYWSVFWGAFGLLLLILDSKTAITGGKEGVLLCIRTVIPALFPFFVISGFLCANITGINLSILRPVGKLLGIPHGSEPLLLLGFLGGYPVGAQNIYDAYRTKALADKDARRMLGFCNNAGPAFIFGMVAGMFSKPYIPWVLWIVHIGSSLLTGALLPGRSKEICHLPERSTDSSFLKYMQKSILSMANVCGWVVLFRVLIAFGQRWFYWILPTELQVLITGLLDLTNGILILGAFSNEALQFVMCSGLLAFGGICVSMQTISVTKELGTGYYFPGKILHTCFSVLLAGIIQRFLFPAHHNYPAIAFCSGAICAVILYLLYRNKKSSRKIQYHYV